MAIHVPGYRSSNKRLRKLGGRKANVVAVLSLTAMVDMFTVLTVFLLQNYNPETGAVLDLPQEVQLPKAARHKQLKPSHVLTISEKGVFLNKRPMARLEDLKDENDLLIPLLKTELENAIAAKFREDKENFAARLKEAVDAAKVRVPVTDRSHSKVTIQADQGIGVLIIKKVMHTASEAGASEINFAVLEQPPDAV